uniref:Uncharacterized protein n=1 Tax=Canis lupus dingo TaxID=286419 RepID=A0A8C0LCI0_CANLU
MNGAQKLDAYAQARQDFIQHFPQIVKMLTEDGMGHLEMGDAIAQLKEVLEYNGPGIKSCIRLHTVESAWDSLFLSLCPSCLCSLSKINTSF